MHKIDASGHNNNKFIDEDLNNGIAGTTISATWLNAVQEEVVNVLITAGIEPDKVTHNQLSQAISVIANKASLSHIVAIKEKLKTSSTAMVHREIFKSQIGAGGDWAKRVIPLVELKSTRTSGSSNNWTIGQLFFNRNNGCCTKIAQHVNVACQKLYSVDDSVYKAGWHFITPRPASIKRCYFTKNGIKYAGVHWFQDIQEHTAHFIGDTTEPFLLNAYNNHIMYSYIDTRDNSVLDAEIKNSLEILD